MAADELTDYYDELELLRQAENRIQRITRTVREGARILEESWKQVSVIHVPPTFPEAKPEDDLVIDGSSWPDRDQLADALSVLAQRERYLALEVNGSRYNIGMKYGLLIAQLAISLTGRERDRILTELVELLATRNARPVQ